MAAFKSVDELLRQLEAHRYVADREVATALYLAIRLERPLLVEGPAGVGKTEIARVLAEALGTRLIRLQCYEGLDASTALYEWNFPKQLLRVRLEESGQRAIEDRERTIFSEEFLLERPLLSALRAKERSPVLLIDEVDRADPEFEAYLMEVLADFQVTIPELGTIVARHRPHVIITSNRSRDLSDALRRRCLYLWVGYPSYEKELAIVQARIPDIAREMAEAVCRFMQKVRALDLEKPPGAAETVDWARALLALQDEARDHDPAGSTLGVIAKTASDLEQLRDLVARGELTLPSVSAPPAQNPAGAP